MFTLSPKVIVEALLLAAEEPLSLTKIHKVLLDTDYPITEPELKAILQELREEQLERPLELKEVASGWRFQIRPEISTWVAKLYEGRNNKYSKAALEVLALIAYRQPITRAEIEDIRGVAVSSNIIKTFVEHEWVKIVAYKEVPGRPAMFGTTQKFLDHLNLKNLTELPPLMEFTPDTVSGITYDLIDAANNSEEEH